MDAELIERLRYLSKSMKCGSMGRAGQMNNACHIAEAATQGTADNTRIAELERDKANAMAAHTKAIVRIDMLEARLATAERDTLERAAEALEADAKLCDCHAFSEGECACGAWCEWKSITSARAVEIVRAAKEQ